jgi:hypothetical protein
MLFLLIELAGLVPVVVDDRRERRGPLAKLPEAANRQYPQPDSNR